MKSKTGALQKDVPVNREEVGGNCTAQSKPRQRSIAELETEWNTCSCACRSNGGRTKGSTPPQTTNSHSTIVPKRTAMTQWDAIASDILREHATKVAVCCIGSPTGWCLQRKGFAEVSRPCIRRQPTAHDIFSIAQHETS